MCSLGTSFNNSTWPVSSLFIVFVPLLGSCVRKSFFWVIFCTSFSVYFISEGPFEQYQRQNLLCSLTAVENQITFLCSANFFPLFFLVSSTHHLCHFEHLHTLHFISLYLILKEKCVICLPKCNHTLIVTTLPNYWRFCFYFMNYHNAILYFLIQVIC